MGKTRPTKKRASILPADWAAAHANDPHRPLFVDDSMIDQDVAACLHEGARRVRFSDALDENKTDRHIDGVRFPGTRPIIIAFMGDSHLGHVAVDYGGVWDYIRVLLANDGLYTVWVGDIIDNTPRFFNAEAVLEQVFSPKQQNRMLDGITKLLSSAGKLICATHGNHDMERDERALGWSPNAAIFAKYGVPYFKGQGMLDFEVGETAYRILMSHQWPGYSIYNPVHGCGRAQGKAPNADVVVGGHFHNPAYMVKAGASFRGLNEPEHVALIEVGTFKSQKGDTYSDRYFNRGLPGVPAVAFMPEERKIKVFRDVEDALMWRYGWETHQSMQAQRADDEVA